MSLNSDASQTGDDLRPSAIAVIPVLDTRIGVRESRISETDGLVEALECECHDVVVINVRDPNPSVLFGGGQLQNIEDRADEHNCDLVVIDGALTPIQQRNLERRLSRKVIDRTGLILEIFGLRAQSKAGRLQVEVARLAYERSRLVRTWTHLERQRGGQGFISGPGETQIEADRRMLDATLIRLRKQLSQVEQTRRLQRAGRIRNEVPVVALVGYTNAGKSTLFNRLAHSSVLAKDMPFATLDPTMRKVSLDGRSDIVLTDTVGFISDLPTPLVESFKATLEETIAADLLLHVHDASSVDVDLQAEDVTGVLTDLEELTGLDRPPIIDVWHKIDLLNSDEKAVLQSRLPQDEAHVFVSSLSGEGFDSLAQTILEQLSAGTRPFKLCVPLSQSGEVRAWLYRNSKFHGEDTQDDTVIFDVALAERAFGQLQSLFPDIILLVRGA